MFSRKSKLIMLLMVTSLLLIISACSGNSESSDVEEDAEPEEYIEEGDFEEISQKEQENLSDALIDTDIWFEVELTKEDTIAKDASIFTIYTFEEDTLTTYSTTDSTDTGGLTSIEISEIIGMSNDEIIEQAKKSEIEYDSDLLVNEPYDLRIWSDDTGNITESMDIKLESHASKLGYPELKFDYPIEGNILDEYFEGYVFNDMDTSYNPALVRRVDEKELGGLKYNSPDTDKDYILVDDKD